MRALVVPLCVVALAAAVAVVPPAMRAEDPPPAGMPPLVGIWGARSAIKERSYLRATNAEEWTALWLRHAGADPAEHTPYYNVAGVPDVDFGRCMVVAILGGESSNSAGIRVESVSEAEDRVLVRFDHRSYQTAGPAPDGGRVACTPFGFFVVPRSAKALVLEENVQGLIGHPPKWKERARFEALPR